MAILIDGVESLLYGNPCEGDESVNETHRLIATNIEGEDLASRIQKAQVVILLRQDENIPQQTLDGRVIRHYWGSKNQLLADGPIKVQYSWKGVFQALPVFNLGFLPFSIRSQAKSWDPERITEAEKKHLEHWNEMLGEFVTVFALAYLSATRPHNIFVTYQNDTQNILQLLRYDDWRDRAELYGIASKEASETQLKTLTREYIAELKRCEETWNTLRQERLEERNRHLAEAVQKALQSNEKVWVMAREDHGRYMEPLKNKEVSELYRSLESEKIQYVVLKSFKEGEHAFSYTHDPQATSQVEKEAKEALAQKRQVMREEFENTYPHNTSLSFQWTHMKNITRTFTQEYLHVDDLPKELAERGLYYQWLLEKTLDWSYAPD
ncbi:MAG: hypothetical protein KDK64_03110 [Chlamydiia bacterium]|nr:hypothetical protein [Chlamydiia bacterium]